MSLFSHALGSGPDLALRRVWLGPMPGPDAPHVVPASADLVAETILETVRRPMSSVMVHTVAERLAGQPSASSADRIVERLVVVTPTGRARLAELARWLCRFGCRTRQVQVGLALLSAAGGPGDLPLVARLAMLDDVAEQAEEALVLLAAG